MRRLISSIILVAVISLSFYLPLSGEAIPYTFSYNTIDVPGVISTGAFGINDVGEIAGRYIDGSGTHGFWYDGSIFTTIDIPGANLTEVTDINDSGQIVGYTSATGSPYAFFYDGITFSTVDFPGSVQTNVWGINNAGQIAGIYVKGNQHGFVATGTGGTGDPLIPEPSTIALMSCGLLGLLGICVKRRRKAKT